MYFLPLDLENWEKLKKGIGNNILNPTTKTLSLKRRKNENIQIYPPVKQGIGYLESKKFVKLNKKEILKKINKYTNDNISDEELIDSSENRFRIRILKDIIDLYKSKTGKRLEVSD